MTKKQNKNFKILGVFWEYIKYSAQIILSTPKVRLTIALTKIYVILSDLCYLGFDNYKNNIGTKLDCWIRCL